ncbi:SAF domain-containing protein [Mobiluncus curtisii]|nr:SAF domain-containing protein [Mobiluncus curtisii]
MILAVILVIVTVRVASHLEGYLVAKTTLVAGHTVQSGDIEVISANPGRAAGQYLREGEIQEGSVVVQTIAGGQLIPKASLSQTEPFRKRIVLNLAAPLPSSVKKGDYLEIWKLPDEKSASTFESDTPLENAQKLADKAVFLAEKKSETALGSKNQMNVEISVPEEDLSPILAAVGTKTPLMAIPVAS